MNDANRSLKLKKNHLVVDSPLHAEGCKWGLATVINGPYEDEVVCIMVEYSDGYCICDMGDGKGIEILRIEDMRLWTSVQNTMHEDIELSKEQAEALDAALSKEPKPIKTRDLPSRKNLTKGNGVVK